MRISVYVPCRNGAQTLAPVLAALRNQTRPADEYLLVDGHSTDESVAIARQHGFTVLEQTSEPGLAAGRNLALASATGDVLCGLDADVVADPNFLAELERRFAAHDSVAALCGKLTEAHTQTLPDLWRAVHMQQHYGDEELLNPRFLYGATLAVRTETARQLGGWDRRFAANHEDVDFSQRLLQAGHDLLYAPTCQATHLRTDTLESALRNFRQWFLPAGVTAGHFTCLEVWRRERLDPVIWGIFRFRQRKDFEDGFPELAALTLLLPWTMVLLDLVKLYEDTNAPVGWSDLTDIFAEALAAREAPASVIEQATQALGRFTVPSHAATAGARPLDALTRIDLETYGAASIPSEPAYWQAVDSSFQRLQLP